LWPDGGSRDRWHGSIIVSMNSVRARSHLTAP
jgi:hypothetical protein